MNPITEGDHIKLAVYSDSGSSSLKTVEHSLTMQYDIYPHIKAKLLESNEEGEDEKEEKDYQGGMEF